MAWVMRYLISSKRVLDEKGVLDTCDPAYSIYFNNFNIALEIVPNTVGSTLLNNNYMGNFDGVILSGSGDININENDIPDNKICQYSKERDDTENCLINLALKQKKPLIGICHGMQKINQYFGGILSPYFHCKTETYSDQGIEHDVLVNKNFVSNDKKYIVNQYHDHCILEKHLAANMDIFATDPRYKTVEGFCNKEMRILCMQWHPERSITDNSLSNIVLEKFI